MCFLYLEYCETNVLPYNLHSIHINSPICKITICFSLYVAYLDNDIALQNTHLLLVRTLCFVLILRFFCSLVVIGMFLADQKKDGKQAARGGPNGSSSDSGCPPNQSDTQRFNTRFLFPNKSQLQFLAFRYQLQMFIFSQYFQMLSFSLLVRSKCLAFRSQVAANAQLSAPGRFTSRSQLAPSVRFSILDPNAQLFILSPAQLL